MTLSSAGDLAYSVTTFQLKDGAGKITEQGNSVQIWKLRSDGKWQIVLVFAPAAVNGKERFRARPDGSPASLLWYPVFADDSPNGVLGYTTGRGELRAIGNFRFS